MHYFMMFAVTELPISLILLITLFRISSYENGRNYFYNVIYATGVWALILWIITEGLSLFECIDYTPMAVAWGVVCIILIIAIFLKLKSNSLKYQELFRIVFKPIIDEFSSKFTIVLMMFFVAIIAMAVIIPTYNYDSMVYHCARIAHWTQNHSVRHFATSAVEQVGSPIFAEYINLNIYVLMLRHDNFFNLLQAFSFLFSGYIIKKISEKLGAKIVYQNIAMFIFYATPIAFAESMTCQVDNVVTVCGLLFIYLIMDFWDEKLVVLHDKEYRKKLALIFVFVGLGYITKPSVCFLMAVALVGMIIQFCRNHEKIGDILKVVAISGVICIAIAFPYFARNYMTFGSLSPEEVGARQLVGTLNPLYLFINFLKNFSMNLIQRLTLNSRAFLESMVYAVASMLKVNADAETISENGGVFDLDHNDPYNPGNDTATNPLVFYCYIIAIIVYVMVVKKRGGSQKTLLTRYGRMVFVSTIALFTFLRWEIYVTRYEIAFLASMCPFIATVMSEFFAGNFKNKRLALGLVTFFIIADTILLFEYHTNYFFRALDNREAGYFFAFDDAYPAREHAVKVIKEGEYNNLGYFNTGNDVEYTIWTMLRDYDIRIENININNSTRKYVDAQFVPDIILNTIPNAPDEDFFEYNGITYHLLFTEGERTKLYVAE